MKSEAKAGLKRVWCLLSLLWVLIAVFFVFYFTDWVSISALFFSLLLLLLFTMPIWLSWAIYWAYIGFPVATNLKIVLQRFYGAIALAKSENFIWSANPGCFEHHLQRKCNNPLFDKKERTVSQYEINRAKQKDFEDAQELQKRIEKFRQSLPNEDELGWVPDAMNTIRDEIDELIRRSFQISGVALDFLPFLTELRKRIIETWSLFIAKDDQAIKKLNVAQQHLFASNLFNPFVLQIIREDSPISSNIAASVLSEDVETIREFCNFIQDQNAFRQELARVVKEMIGRNESIPLLEEKLKLINDCLSDSSEV